MRGPGLSFSVTVQSLSHDSSPDPILYTGERCRRGPETTTTEVIDYGTSGKETGFLPKPSDTRGQESPSDVTPNLEVTSPRGGRRVSTTPGQGVFSIPLPTPGVVTVGVYPRSSISTGTDVQNDGSFLSRSR